MDAKKRIDKILTAVHGQVAEEIGLLLGVEFSLSGDQNTLTTKKNFFDNLVGKQILAKINLTGEVEGRGCLVLGIKDAIRLGGTLIMLPDAELEEVAGREEYTGETEDAYGEIANIIAGSYTKMFEEMLNKRFRFIRKEQQILLPVKVDVEGDEPVPDQLYYQVGCSMTMEGRQMGDIYMLLPAEPFGLMVEGSADVQRDAAGTADEAGLAARPAPDTAVTVDPEKHTKRIDKLLAESEKKLTEELSSLLGVEVKFAGVTTSLISKEDFFFEELEGKQVMADLEVSGDLQGKSYFFAGLKDSIHLGGVLIMLPPSELENVVNDEEFGEDVRDAYDEVANIVSAVFTSTFEGQYTDKIRFVKKGVQQVVPMKVDVESELPVPDQQYYMSSMSMQVDGTVLGNVRMLLPAAMFHLEQSAEPAASTESSPGPQQAAAASIHDPRFNTAKHRQRVDSVLKECAKKVQEEIGALLGTEMQLDEVENRHISKNDFFFDVANGKQVFANMDVVGDLKDTGYLCVSLKDAIYMGGVLIMLPPSELAAVVVEEEFSDDSRDAYGEIANIIGGVYTAVFEEHYPRKLRFVKNDLELVEPMAVDIDSAEPIPDVAYYMSSMSLSLEGERRGRIHLLFPARMLQLDAVPQEVPGAASDAATETATSVSAPQPGSAGADHARQASGEGRAAVDILIISDDEAESARLASVARDRGLGIRQVTFKDNIKSAVTSDLKAVYIVMREVNEQAFGIAIKISSFCSLPLVAAGPGWTRSKVIKAVKYGVNDILLTPASPEDIQENLDNNLVQMAA